ncbi:hypothetical protein [Scytonema sp. NUACC26]|uniref:hypothetical protein n=1 Tax=Scytonema sp. NUACC26 TaxID=3140176 RepID=UPI0034DB9F64
MPRIVRTHDKLNERIPRLSLKLAIALDGFSTLMALMNRMRGAIPNSNEFRISYFPLSRVMEERYMDRIMILPIILAA